jgi:integrase
MSIYPDKKGGLVTGRWRVEVQLGGLRKRGRFDTMAEGRAAEKRWTAELARGDTADTTLRPARLTPRTLSQLVAKAAPMLWDRSGHGELSVKKVRWIIDHCGDPQLDRIPGDFVDRVVVALRKANKAPATINRYLSALHAVLGWGAKQGRRYVPILPEFSWQDEDEGRIRYLTQDEEVRLLATLRALGYHDIAELCIVALDTGCRRGELLAAQPDQLDGKWLRLWKTKNGHARSVPLTDRARNILSHQLPWSIQPHQLRYAWGKAKIALGFSDDEDFVFHALRHTSATRLVGLGVNLRVIQQFMGHRAIQTTLRYAHVSDDMLSRAGEAINNSQAAATALEPVHLRTVVRGDDGGMVPHKDVVEAVE